MAEMRSLDVKIAMVAVDTPNGAWDGRRCSEEYRATITPTVQEEAADGSTGTVVVNLLFTYHDSPDSPLVFTVPFEGVWELQTFAAATGQRLASGARRNCVAGETIAVSKED